MRQASLHPCRDCQRVVCWSASPKSQSCRLEVVRNALNQDRIFRHLRGLGFWHSSIRKGNYCGLVHDCLILSIQKEGTGALQLPSHQAWVICFSNGKQRQGMTCNLVPLLTLICSMGQLPLAGITSRSDLPTNGLTLPPKSAKFGYCHIINPKSQKALQASATSIARYLLLVQ